jgi:hypothetical protein
MALLSEYATSCGYAVDEEKASRGCAVMESEMTGDKINIAVDADQYGMNDQGRRIHFENQMLPLMSEAQPGALDDEKRTRCPRCRSGRLLEGLSLF